MSRIRKYVTYRMADEQAETFIRGVSGPIKPSLPIVNRQVILHPSSTTPSFANDPAITALVNSPNFDTICDAIGQLKTGDDDANGTAFFVSPTILLTARHNLYIPNEAVPIAPLHPGPYVFSIHEDPHHNNNNPGIRLVATDPQEQIRASAIAVNPHDEVDVDPIGRTPLTKVLDFCFLRTPQGFQSPTFLLPQSLVPIDGPVSVIGYPAPTTNDELNAFFQLHSAFGARFFHKHAGFGSLIANGRIVVHNCSTLTGSSGGPILNLANNNGSFVGIHTTGHGHTHNTGFSVDHPIFKMMYRRIVFPTLDQHTQNLLAPYLQGVPVLP